MSLSIQKLQFTISIKMLQSTCLHQIYGEEKMCHLDLILSLCTFFAINTKGSIITQKTFL